MRMTAAVIHHPHYPIIPSSRHLNSTQKLPNLPSFTLDRIRL
jgi:hypothetical protein